MKKILLSIGFLSMCICTMHAQVLYGTVTQGGSSGTGVLNAYNVSTNYLGVNSLGAANLTGSSPAGMLTQASNGLLYGMTTSGGASGLGVIYSFNPQDSSFVKLFDFDGTNGANPYGSLIQAANGKLYGMTSAGGAGQGVIFSFDLSSSLFTKLRDLSVASGSTPYGSLLQASNGLLYGMTSGGGAGSSGVIFSLDPATNNYAKLVDLNGDIGSVPYGSLIQATDGNLYGMTSLGGLGNQDRLRGVGVLFSFNPLTAVYTKLKDFSDPWGCFPYGSLLQASDGKLYGLTSDGGDIYNLGVMFSFDITGSVYEVVLDFNGATGSSPYGNLMQASDGKLYAMASGADFQVGSIFSFDIDNSMAAKLKDYNSANGAYPPYGGGFIELKAAPVNYNITATTGANGTVAPPGVTSVPGGSTRTYTITPNPGYQIQGVSVDGAPQGPITTYTFTNVTSAHTISATFAPVAAGCTTPTLSAAITNVSCKGGSTGGIVLTATGGSSPFTYAWTGPNAFTATSKDISSVKAGLYSVKVTGTGGCYFNASYRVSEPLAALTIHLANGVITCYGGTTNVAVYGSGGTTPYTGTGTFANKAAGTYTYTITDAKGCSATGSITVVQPAAIVSSVVITPVSCKGSSTGGIDLSVSGGVGNFGYSWTGPNGFTATTQDITNVKGGIYSVRVSSGQCYTNATYRVTEPLAPLGASIAASTIVCAGGTTNVYISPSGGTTPYTGGGNIPNQAAGPHSYTVTDARGCTYVVSINIPAGTGTKPTTPVITGPSGVTPNQANVQFTASTSGASGYSWVVPVGASITSGQNTSAIRVKFGTTGGQVKVTATNGCGNTAQVSKTVTTGSARLITKTFVTPLTTEQYFTTSPNPAQGMVTVKFSAARSDRKFEIRVSDVNGKTMFTKSGLTAAGQNMLKLDMTKYSSSLYFITLISDDQIQTQKLIRAK